MGRIIAHLVASDAAKALDFYKNAFGAEVLGVHKTPDGKVMHAEMKIGGARLMLADEFPGMGCPRRPRRWAEARWYSISTSRKMSMASSTRQ